MTLAQYRTEHGMTLAELATKLLLSRQGVRDIECGGSCRLATAMRIVALTDGQVTLPELVAPAQGVATVHRRPRRSVQRAAKKMAEDGQDHAEPT